MACAAAYAIFGFNIIFCKDIALANVISPLAMFSLRAGGAALLFWIISLFIPGEKMLSTDIIKIAGASILGLIVPQVTFLFAITMTTSIDTSILGSFTPIWTMFIAAIVLKEPLSLKKVSGVAISFLGAMLLIFNSISMGGGADRTSPLGIVLLFFNTLSFALYLGVYRPLLSKYSVINFMKWSFLWAFLLTFPFSFKGLATADYAAMTPRIVSEIAFVIIFSTCVAYFLIPYGQKRLRPTIVSLYTYLQPIIACVISIYIGMDMFTWQKLLGALCVFAGVWLVNKSRAAATESLLPAHHLLPPRLDRPDIPTADRNRGN